MEVMRRVARQRCDLLIVFKVTLADGTLSVLLEVLSVELAEHHFVDDAVPLALLVIHLSHVVSDGLDHAWGAADAE